MAIIAEAEKNQIVLINELTAICRQGVELVFVLLRCDFRINFAAHTHVLRHFYYFAATILDRVYFLRGEFDRFCVTIHGKEALQRQNENAKGCILLGSHLGSFEMLRALGVMQGGFSLKVLMNSAHNQNITRFFDGLNATIAGTVIAPDRPDTLIRARESMIDIEECSLRAFE